MSKQERTSAGYPVQSATARRAGLTYNAMLAFKKYKQSPVIISRNGQIVAVPPEDMPPVSVPKA